MSSIDVFAINSYLFEEVQSHAQDGYAQGENQIDMIETLTFRRLKTTTFWFKGIQLKRFKLHFIFDLK